MVLLGLLEEELSCFLVEARHSLRWQIGALCHHKGAKERVYQILVLLIKKLVHNERHARGWVLDLTHHCDELTNDDSTIYLALHLSKTLLKDLDSAVLHGKVTESPIVTIEKHGGGHFLTLHDIDWR